MTPITRDFADGRYAFDINKIGLLKELQQKTGRGPMALFQRLASGQWEIEDLTEVIRLGLIGGGTKPADAAVLVERYVVGHPLLRSVRIAVDILEQLMLEPENRQSGNGAGEATA
jgi:hypothetical protein